MFPVVGIIGPRQVGKTTLARQVAATHAQVSWYDLEHPRDLARLSEPGLALEPLRGLVVIDEVQRRPDLFPLLRSLADRPEQPARFLVLGSASPNLLRQGSESLAGRVVFHRLDGLSLHEVGNARLDDLWVRGGFPRSFLAASAAASAEWREAFVASFLERDLPQLGIGVPAPAMRRFWTMLAHYHGQIWNGAELARAFAVSAPTVKRYLETLEATFVVRTLRPWHVNIAKRQVRAPKVYLADTGILHTLLGLADHDDLLGHPKVGASWEGFALHEVLMRLGARSHEAYFWATHAGAELDLLVVRGTRRLGFEVKRTDAPRASRSIRNAIADLHLQRVDIIHAGPQTFPLATDVRAVALSSLEQDLEPLT